MNVTPFQLSRRIAVVLLLLLLSLLFAGVVMTRGGDPELAYNAPPSLPNTTGLVDQTPLQTARILAAQAATPQEREYAEQALRLADHEVDQAFDAALREAAEDTPKLSGEALAISQHIVTLSARIADDQQRIAGLQKSAFTPSARMTPKQQVLAQDNVQQLAIDQAQLALDQDQLDDLKQDLIRAGGDPHARIEQALAEHEAVEKKAAAIPLNTATAQLESPESLVTMAGKIRALSSLRSRSRQLIAARSAALAYLSELTAQRDSLDREIDALSEQNNAGETPDRLNRLHQMAQSRKAIAALDRRSHDLQQLAANYDNWEDLVRLQQRTVLQRIFRVSMFIVVIILIVLLFDGFVLGLLERHIADRRRRNHLRVLSRLGLQVVALLLILIVLFGPPHQLSTILGLLTAGLAVVMKDFIVAFLGWFVLMGRNGMRVGDWVEINGVTGEVVEITLMRTVLLETGNWTDSSHLTGRRVAFMNGYAIEGRFFNFSTAGQWLWDELHITVPAGLDSQQKISEILRSVEEATRENARLAEAEWQHAAHSYSVTNHVSAAPSLDVRPAGDGLEAVVRYITRAQERIETRTRLYQRVIDVLHTSQPQTLAPSNSNV